MTDEADLFTVLQARLDRAVATAERRIADADFERLFARGRRLRAAVPPEIAGHLTESVRHFLLAQRAVLDWLLKRLEARRDPRPPGSL